MVGKELVTSIVEQSAASSSNPSRSENLSLAANSCVAAAVSRATEGTRRAAASPNLESKRPHLRLSSCATEPPSATPANMEFHGLFPEADDQTLNDLTWAIENAAHPKVQAWLKSSQDWNDFALKGTTRREKRRKLCTESGISLSRENEKSHNLTMKNVCNVLLERLHKLQQSAIYFRLSPPSQSLPQKRPATDSLSSSSGHAAVKIIFVTEAATEASNQRVTRE